MEVSFVRSLVADQDRARTIATSQIAAMPKTRALVQVVEILSIESGISWY